MYVQKNKQYICIVYCLIDYDETGTPNFTDINPDMSGVFSDNGSSRVGRVGRITVNEQKFLKINKHFFERSERTKIDNIRQFAYQDHI